MRGFNKNGGDGAIFELPPHPVRLTLAGSSRSFEGGVSSGMMGEPMANVVVLVDPDRDRRTQFVRVVEPKLAPVDGLIGGRLSAKDCCVLWDAATSAPVKTASDDTGLAVVLGDAVQRETGEPLSAVQWRVHVSTAAGHAPPVYEGFHVAVAYDAVHGILVGADPLGLFPVYYYARDDVLLVGSSPELFRHHPVFRREFNPAGLVGILLTNGLVDGQTLFRGVTRLSPRSVVCWQPRAAAKEAAQFEWPLSTRYYDLPFSAHLRLMHETLEALMPRYADGRTRIGLFLSGGRDSRMLGGLLKRKHMDVVAWTFGRSTDFDLQCARRVAASLGLEHHCADVAYTEYAWCADLSIRWEHVANGLNNITAWSAYAAARGVAPRFALGTLCDAIVGGSNLAPAYSRDTDTLSFARLLDYLNGRGVPLDVLRNLLRRDRFGDLVEATIARCRTRYESYSERESQRTFCFSLEHHERFSVGSMAWICSFWGWPMLPFCDLALLELIGGLPAASLAERRLQDGVLCAYFSRLASLPLDRNTYDTTPLLLGPRHLLRLYLRSLAARCGLSSGEGSAARPTKGQPYYYRTWDFNNPGWRAVRKMAEPYRRDAGEFFNRRVFDELLPPPDQPFVSDRGLWGASAAKLLLGFLLWANRNLSR